MLKQYTEAKNSLLAYLADCRKLAEQCQDKAQCRVLDSLAHELKDLTYNIAVIGSIKRGKSTLINALLGQRNDDISPIGLTVCTSAITKYRNYPEGMAHEPHAEVVYEGREQEPERVSYSGLRELISQKHNPDNAKGIRSITVYGDFPTLGSCCLVDTPGADACIERHGEMVCEILPSADAIIMPVMATEAMTNNEQEMLQNLAENSQRRVFYVITKADRISIGDMQEVENYTYRNIADAGLPRPDRIYKVSAKKVYDALKNGASESDLAAVRSESGLKQLESDLGTFIVSHSAAGNDLVRRLTAAVDATKGSLAQYRAKNEAFIQLQSQDREQIEKDIALANEEFSTLKKEMKKSLAKFCKDWERAVYKSMSRFDQVVERAADRLVDRFSQAGFIKTLSNTFTLKSQIVRTVNPEIQVLTDELQEKLAEILEKLNEDYANAYDLYIKKTSAGTSTMAMMGVLSVGSGAAATVTMVSLPAIQGVIAAISSYTAASSTAASVISSGGIFAKMAAVFGCGELATASGTAATALGGIGTAVCSAIIPVAIGIAALAAVAPISRFFLENATPAQVNKAAQKCKKNIEEQLDKAKAEVVRCCEEQLEDKQEELDNRVAELREQLATLDPEKKAQAEAQNSAIDKLVGTGEGISNEIRLLY